jgi:ATP-dependent RNA helicase RhlE
VFTRTKHGANRLAEQLGRDGIATAAIHGNKGQAQRTRALADFKAGRVTVLVATDLAARGLDIDALPHVVNFELPMVPEDYVHRIGRTGRAGLVGEAISLVCVDEAPLLRDIERLLRHPIATEVVAGFEPDRSIRPEPIRLRSAEHRAPAARARRPEAGDRHPSAAARRPPAPRAGRPAAPRPAAPRPAAPRPSAPRPSAARPAAPGRPATDRFVALPGERFARRDAPAAPAARRG